MEITDTELVSWVGSFLWPLARVAALFSVAPILGTAILPRRIKLLLVLIITATLMPVLSPVPGLDPLSPASILITAQQVLIGLALGLLIRLAFDALSLAGQVIATQMGLGFATLIDPNSNTQMPLLSHFYHLLGMLIFLSLNGHLLLIQLIAESFEILPIASSGLMPHDLNSIVSWAAWLFAGAFMVAIPAVTSIMVVNLAFGVMSRAAPQLNIFAVGFPISLLLGLLIINFTLSSLLPQFRWLLDEAFQFARMILL